MAQNMDTDETEVSATTFDGVEDDDAFLDDEFGHDESAPVVLGDLLEDEDNDGESDSDLLEELDDGESEDQNHSQESKSYKSLQSMQSKTKTDLDEAVKQNIELSDKFSAIGGVDQAVAALEFIRTDPEMVALIQKRNNGKQGVEEIDTSEYTPEQKEAFALVEKIVENKLGPALSKLNNQLESRINPVAEQVRQQSIDSIAEDMLGEYGDLFESQAPSMAELGKSLPQSVKDNPTKEHMEDLFFKSLRRDGKMDAYQRAAYTKKVESKKEKHTGSPTSPQGKEKMPNFKKPTTMMEAANIAAAKRRIKAKNQ